LARTGDKHCEVDMPDMDDDSFGEDEDEAIDDFNRLSELLVERITEFAEEEDVPDGMLPALLLRLSLTMRMMTYMVSAAKPSGSGLELDLDRYRREAEELIAEMKKDADRLVAEAQETLAAAELEEDDT
jgi:hypothetical protein